MKYKIKAEIHCKKVGGSYCHDGHYTETGTYLVKCPKCSETLVIRYRKENDIEEIEDKYCSYCGKKLVKEIKL